MTIAGCGRLAHRTDQSADSKGNNRRQVHWQAQTGAGGGCASPLYSEWLAVVRNHVIIAEGCL